MTSSSADYHREWYQKNKERRRVEIRANTEARVSANREKLLDYFKTHPCVDCGEDDPVVLEFDHVRGVKVMEVSKMMVQRTWPRVLEEIAKCDVRCANCHKRRTAASRGFWSHTPVLQV